MTKLEELSELLVSEIKDFEETVKKLEKIQEQKILIDSRDLKNFIRLQQENLEKTFISHKQEMKNLSHALEKAKAYPTWALIFFVVSLTLNGMLAYVILAGLI